MNNSEYKPKSRRPIANVFRKTAHWSVDLCVKHNIHPDTISYLSMIFAALAAICFWKSGQYKNLLIIGPVFCYLRLWCNMVDGMVAMKSGKASLKGEILNDLPDRISDTIIFVGVAHSGYVHLHLGYLTAIFALFVSYIGIFGQAVGAHREFSGIMSKPWRMVILHIGAWVVLFSEIICCGNCKLTILDITLVIIILGCIQTMFIRLKRIMDALKEQQKEN